MGVDAGKREKCAGPSSCAAANRGEVGRGDGRRGARRILVEVADGRNGGDDVRAVGEAGESVGAGAEWEEEVGRGPRAVRLRLGGYGGRGNGPRAGAARAAGKAGAEAARTRACGRCLGPTRRHRCRASGEPPPCPRPGRRQRCACGADGRMLRASLCAQLPEELAREGARTSPGGRERTSVPWSCTQSQSRTGGPAGLPCHPWRLPLL